MIGTEATIDDPCRSSKRYYVYTGPACNTWLEYDNLADAIAENLTEWVWDRETKLPVYQPAD